MAVSNPTGKRNVRIIIHTAVQDRVFFSDTGPVSVITRQAADAVLKAAQANIGTTYSGEHSGPHLKNSGKVVRSPTGSPNWMVQFRHRAAEVHHEGAGPHNLGSNKAYYRAPGATFSDVDGYARAQKYVPGGGFGPAFSPLRLRGYDHPGHKANRYLTNAARDVGLRVSQTPGGQFGRRGIARVPRGFV